MVWSVCIIWRWIASGIGVTLWVNDGNDGQESNAYETKTHSCSIICSCMILHVLASSFPSVSKIFLLPLFHPFSSRPISASSLGCRSSRPIKCGHGHQAFYVDLPRSGMHNRSSPTLHPFINFYTMLILSCRTLAACQTQQSRSPHCWALTLPLS